MSDELVATNVAGAHQPEVSELGLPPDEVVGALLDQVDAKVAAIEASQKNVAPFQTALASAQTDYAIIQAGAAQATDPAVKDVYQKAIIVCKKLIEEIKTRGEGAIERIVVLQTELKKLLDQLKKIDPKNPLAQEI